MKRLISFLFWSFLFLVVFFGLDQLLVRVEMPLPVLAEVQTFYVDFRTRLLELGHRLPVKLGSTERKVPASAPARPKAAPVQPKAAEPALSPPEKTATPARPGPVPPAGASNPRYLYVDRQGELRFADSLEEIPVAYRKDAQQLEK